MSEKPKSGKNTLRSLFIIACIVLGATVGNALWKVWGAFVGAVIVIVAVMIITIIYIFRNPRFPEDYKWIKISGELDTYVYYSPRVLFYWRQIYSVAYFKIISFYISCINL